MANDKPKIEPKIIRVEMTRPAFFKLHTAEWRTNKQGVIDKGTAAKPKKPRYQVTLLVDPTNVETQKTIADIKTEAARLLDHFYGGRDKWPKDNEATGRKGILNCFGIE